MNAQNAPGCCVIIGFMPRYLISFWLPTFPHHLSFLNLNTLVCDVGNHLPPIATGSQKRTAVNRVQPLTMLTQPTWRMRLLMRGLNFLRHDWDKEQQTAGHAIVEGQLEICHGTLLLGLSKSINVISSFGDL